MTNNTASNYTEKLARVFMEKFESSRVLCKAVNTQLLTPRIEPSNGGTVSFKRPHDYNAIETSGGDISMSTKSDILAGKATGEVQNYITIATEWTNLEEALQLDQLDQILAPMAARAVTTLELNLGAFMYKNCNGAIGTPGTRPTTWLDVAEGKAYFEALGVPQDTDWNYVMTPYDAVKLANVQTGLAANGQVDSAWQRAQVTNNLAGLKVMTSNALASFTTGSESDREGAIDGTPTVTYVGHKDTMIQTIPVKSFGAGATVIKAGEVIQVTGMPRLSLSTREQIQDNAGNTVLYRGTVTEDVTLSSGAGDITVAGPAIYEANGQYNTVESALANNDVVTLLGSESELRQPNLLFHPNAFGVGTVKLPKLYSTDTVATTEDGFSLRVSKYSDGDSNKQMVRFDILPAFICFNPFFATQAWG
jgi:hypothetical protein